LPRAIEGGLCLPLLYNTSGYERVQTLRWLENVIDIWLPDSKYAGDEVAVRLSSLPDYVEHNRAALLEMYRQVGPELVADVDHPVDGEGMAQRGMIVRHLVLPGGLAGSRQVMEWLAENLSPQVHVSLMNQYFPAYLCVNDPLLGRKVNGAEYDAALDAMSAAGLETGWVQECETEQPADFVHPADIEQSADTEHP
jgi:putative pyruvate formate lyase activating enzyme